MCGFFSNPKKQDKYSDLSTFFQTLICFLTHLIDQTWSKDSRTWTSLNGVTSFSFCSLPSSKFRAFCVQPCVWCLRVLQTFAKIPHPFNYVFIYPVILIAVPVSTSYSPFCIPFLVVISRPATPIGNVNPLARPTSVSLFFDVLQTYTRFALEIFSVSWCCFINLVLMYPGKTSNANEVLEIDVTICGGDVTLLNLMAQIPVNI